MAWYFDMVQFAADVRQSDIPTSRIEKVFAPDPIYLSQLTTGRRVLGAGELAHVCNEFGLAPADYYKERL